jgi:hypothetical protein
MMNGGDILKIRILKVLRPITSENLELIYKEHWTDFVFRYSDEIEIDGKTYDSSQDGKIRRQLILMNGKKPFLASRTIGGVKINESHFINKQLELLKESKSINLELKYLMKRDIYEDFLKGKLNEISKRNAMNPQSNFESKSEMKGVHSFLNAIQTFNTRVDSELSLFDNEFKDEDSTLEQHQRKIENKVLKQINNSRKELKFLLCFENALTDLEYFATCKEKHQIEYFERIIDNRISSVENQISTIKNRFREYWLFGTNHFYAHGYFDLYNLFKSNYENLFKSQKSTHENIQENISQYPTHPETETKTKKPKGYFNQLTNVQKEFISSLIEQGHQKSHIFHELKSTGIISLTEYEFRDFLNKFHNQELDLIKRFTAKSNLSIPIELVNKCREFKDKISKKSQ